MAALALSGPRNDLAPRVTARINRNHPLARGLVAFATPWYDLVRGTPITATLPSGSTNLLGLGCLLGSGSRLDFADDPTLHGWTEYTIVGWLTATTGTQQVNVAVRDRVTPSPDYCNALAVSSGLLFHYCLGATGLSTGFAIPAAFNNGQTYMVGGTAKPSEVTVWLDGQLMNADTTANGALVDPANPWTMGYVPWSGQSSGGVLGPVMMWNRVLGQAEMQQLRVSPFCMLGSG